MAADKLPRRFIVVRVELGEVSDHEATKLGDQLVEFGGAVAEHVKILQEGVALNVRDYCPGNARGRRRMRQLINGYCGAPDDPESDLTDALADICHLAASHSFDPEELVSRALSHFHAEQQSDRPTRRE